MSGVSNASSFVWKTMQQVLKMSKFFMAFLVTKRPKGTGIQVVVNSQQMLPLTCRSSWAQRSTWSHAMASALGKVDVRGLFRTVLQPRCWTSSLAHSHSTSTVMSSLYFCLGYGHLQVPWFLAQVWTVCLIHHLKLWILGPLFGFASDSSPRLLWTLLQPSSWLHWLCENSIFGERMDSGRWK